MSEKEEPFVRLTTRALLADINGEIAQSVEGYQSGQVLLATAYIFAAAGMSGIAHTIIQHGKKLGLPALRAKHSAAIRKTPEGWELQVDGTFFGKYETEQQADDAYEFWRSSTES